MSVVGNITSNYDRSAQSAGAPRTSPARRLSQVNEVNSLHKTSSRPDQKASTSEVEKPAEEDSSESDDGKEVQRLARQYSHVSTVSGSENPFDSQKDSALDPASDKFRPRAWVKSMLKIHAGDEERFKPRSAGIAFRNLSAYGYSAPTDYQKTVGNYGLDLVGLARRAMGHGPRRVDILRNIDGLVRAGEMLVVLGPPGSGCSTFLKTIAGETHGYQVHKDSYMNYQGRYLTIKSVLQPRANSHDLTRNQLQPDAQRFSWRGNIHHRTRRSLSHVDRW